MFGLFVVGLAKRFDLFYFRSHFEDLVSKKAAVPLIIAVLNKWVLKYTRPKRTSLFQTMTLSK